MTETELHEKITEVSRTIFSYCMAKTPTREEAEDLSQDILLALLRSAENIRDDRAFYAFMWGVAGNVYKQWYRKKLQNNTCELTDDIPAEDDLAEEDGNLRLALYRNLYEYDGSGLTVEQIFGKIGNQFWSYMVAMPDITIKNGDKSYSYKFYDVYIGSDLVNFLF